MTRVKINNIQTLIISPIVAKKLEVPCFLDDALNSNSGFNPVSKAAPSNYEKRSGASKEESKLTDISPFYSNEMSKSRISYPFNLYEPNTDSYTHFY